MAVMRTVDLDTVTPEDLYDEIHEAIGAGADLLLTQAGGRGGLLSPYTARPPAEQAARLGR
jgi:hypothetical protein